MGHTHYWLSLHCSHQKCQTSYSQYHCQQMSTQHQTKKNQTNHSNHCQMGTDHQCRCWKGILVHLHLCRRGLPGAPGVLAESFCICLYRTSSRPTGSWTPEVWTGLLFILWLCWLGIARIGLAGCWWPTVACEMVHFATCRALFAPRWAVCAAPLHVAQG